MISDPDDGAPIKTSHGAVQIVGSAKQIDAALWKRTFSEDLLDSRFYELIEETLREQFDFRYAILRNDRRGETAVQPFFLVNHEISTGLPSRVRSILSRAPDWLLRRLKIKMLGVGCVAGEGQLALAEPWYLEALDEALGHYASRVNAKLIFFKDFPARDREAFAPLLRKGYRRVASMPSTKLDLGFDSFEDYLKTRLSRESRSQLRRKFRDSQKLGTLSLEVVNDATPYADDLFDLYLQTHLRSEFRFEQLTRDFFSQLGKRMPDHTRFFLWRKEGKLVAFALCMVHRGVLHYLNLGMDYPEALNLHLYDVVWRDLMSWALDQNLNGIKMGQLNYEAKFRLGFQLAPLDLYVRHTSVAFNPFFAFALTFLEPTRYAPALRKFPNAREL
jgi:hypothetical protein